MSSATRPQQTFSELWRDIRGAIVADGREALVLRLTVFMVLMYGADRGTVQIAIVVICGVMLLWPAVMRSPLLWWPLVAALAATNAQRWYLIDNHKYLIMYWALACAILVTRVRHGDSLEVTARRLVMVVFAFATFWKVYGGEFASGGFMSWTFLTDDRVEPLAAYLLGGQSTYLMSVKEAIRVLGTSGVGGRELPIEVGGWLPAFTLGLSWLGLLLEAGVAAAHLSGGNRTYYLRHVSLLTFIGLTYFLLPVRGFAFVLGILGIAQCRENDWTLTRLYLALFAVIQLTMLEWQAALPTGGP